MIRKFIENYKAKQKRKRYENGFNWAMDAFYVEGMSTDRINGYLYNGFDCNEFDQGARDAINVIAWS